MDDNDRRRLAVTLIEAGVMLGAAWLADGNRAPLRPWLWHHTTRIARTSAQTLADLAWSAGRLAIHAENQYWRSIQP